MDALVVPQRPPAPVIQIDDLRQALESATDPVVIKEINAKADAFEQYMHDCGMYSIEDMRPVNELRIDARWKLGGALKAVVRAPEGRPKTGSSVTSFWKWTKDTLGLSKPVAVEAQRIHDLPLLERDKAKAEARAAGRLLRYDELIVIARPYWYKASREQKHKDIRAGAAGMATLEHLGPFPLIYADPPWKFKTYSELDSGRMPDQHYPTLSLDQIKDFRIGSKAMRRIIHKDAALLLWCTSSNMPQALEVMDAWGFTFKSSAIWVKSVQPDDGETMRRFGMGLVFRNMHEVLLYGTRGKMPGPQYQPPSVFFYPRGEHSAKPPEVRWEIEKMYPDFDETTRLELFAREKAKGWTRYGFEA